MSASRLLVKSLRLVVDLKKPRPGAVLVEDGVVAALAEHDAPAPAGAEVIDYGDLALMAGLVDGRARPGETPSFAAGFTAIAPTGTVEPLSKDALVSAAAEGRTAFVSADWSPEAVALAAGLCAETGARVHLAGFADGAALPALKSAKSKGLPLTADVMTRDLTFAAEEKAEGVRPRANRELLWIALRDGVLDMIAPDERPRLPQYALPSAWAGFGVRHGTIPSLSRLMCEVPARLAGLTRKGKLAPGFDADLIAWDPDASFVAKKAPYEGRVLRGVVRSAIAGGKRVYDRAPAVRS